MEDEWALIMRADQDQHFKQEQEKKISEGNQKRYYSDFLKRQVEEKKRKEDLEKMQKQNDLVVRIHQVNSYIGTCWKLEQRHFKDRFRTFTNPDKKRF